MNKLSYAMYIYDKSGVKDSIRIDPMKQDVITATTFGLQKVA